MSETSETSETTDQPQGEAQPEILEVLDESAEGRVQWYGLAKGYGFVTVDDVEDDVFVHHSELQDPDNLMTGDKVRFRLVRTDRGLQAQDLEVLVEAAPPSPVA